MTIDPVADARYEYSQTGTLKVSTFAALTNAGYDAEILMAQFESNLGSLEEKENG